MSYGPLLRVGEAGLLTKVGEEIGCDTDLDPRWRATVTSTSSNRMPIL